MHLSLPAEMHPYFAASGHENYTRSSYMHLQSMSMMDQRNPNVYQKLLAGYHIVRRRDHYFAGLFTDYIIRQTLMRNRTSLGGFTRSGDLTVEGRAVCL